jgi:wyosine [tRNA(Phe)-imidazoG37] synthetase (radical SAM superfamily)
VYCECGLNTDENKLPKKLPTQQEVYTALENKLIDMARSGLKPDVITFAGNGEPTMHPKFPEIIDDTIKLRNMHAPTAKISVLSNATMLHKSEITEALKKIDQNILKLDSGLENTISEINQPVKKIKLEVLVDQFLNFQGKLIIQSLFTRGNINGKYIDNTTDKDLEAWIQYLKIIKPEMVMIYTIERDTPYSGLQKIPVNELRVIAKRVNSIGIKTQVSG